MIGATLGGGIGRQDGVLGLIIDALESVQIVTASGQLIIASETINPDLFWGIRGAGANFGVVVSATYKLSPLPEAGIYTGADLIFSAAQNVSYFKTVEALQMVPELTVETIMAFNKTTNEPNILTSIVYVGRKEDAVRAIQPLLDVQPTYSHIIEIPWNRLPYETTFGLDKPVCEDRQIYDIYSVSTRVFSADAMIASYEKLAGFWQAHPEGKNSVIVLETWANQATVAVPDDATAYPWRDATTYM